MSWKIELSIQLGLASLNRMFNLPTHVNNRTIERMVIHPLFVYYLIIRLSSRFLLLSAWVSYCSIVMVTASWSSCKSTLKIHCSYFCTVTLDGVSPGHPHNYNLSCSYYSSTTLYETYLASQPVESGCELYDQTTQQNSYFISHIHCTVTALWLNSDCEVTVSHCWQLPAACFTVNQQCSHSTAYVTYGIWVWWCLLVCKAGRAEFKMKHNNHAVPSPIHSHFCPSCDPSRFLFDTRI